MRESQGNNSRGNESSRGNAIKGWDGSDNITRSKVRSRLFLLFWGGGRRRGRAIDTVFLALKRTSPPDLICRIFFSNPIFSFFFD